MEDRQKIIEKLVKIKALAERGVGGEQQTAQQMYEALKKRYGITDEEVNRAAVPVDISGIDLKKFWGISFRMALIVYSLNEEQKTCEMCRQVLLQEPECETCSPYRGDTKRNKEYARKLTRAAINNGFVPVTVHLYLTEVTDDQNPEERRRGMAAGMKILENCKYILVGDKYGVSDGMKAEMTLAALKGKVMLYEQDGKIYLVDSREETTGGQDNE